MKLSILTATYNRAELLKRLYKSISDNMIQKMEVEWLIMDDGSTDNTMQVINSFGDINGLYIKYYKQGNQGKMQAINNLMEFVTGELMIESDSDDYFVKDAFKNIYACSSELLNDDELYAMVFLRDDKHKNIQGKTFENTQKNTTMFDMYFKENMDGEKILVFKSSIRKLYRYKVEQGEKFSTEARLFYEIEEKYKVKCYNIQLVSGDYTQEGYTKNINRIFMNNPVGFFKYFEEILSREMSKTRFNKRLYVIKHYILFHVISNKKINLKKVKNTSNKLLIIILYLPGIIKSKKFVKDNT